MALLNNTTITTNNHTVPHLKYQENKNHVNVTLPPDSMVTRAIGHFNISNIRSIEYSRRSFLYVSHSCRASITLEAAIALPIFILFFMAFVSIINIIYVQLTLQIKLEETARLLSKSGYAAIAVASPEENEGNISATVLSIATIYNNFMNEDMKDFLDDSTVLKGSKGVNFLSTNVDLKSGMVDLIISYNMTLPFVPENILSFPLSNRCYYRLYIGCELPSEQESVDFYVYYSRYGGVYHTQKYCRYLLNYSKVVTFNNLDLSTYQPCALCVSESLSYLKLNNTTVYITENGYAYHTSLDCRSFTGDTLRMRASALKDDPPMCSECLKGK